MSIQLIDQVEQGDTEALAQAEIYWQEQLRGLLKMVGMHTVEEEKSNFWDTLQNNYVKM